MFGREEQNEGLPPGSRRIGDLELTPISLLHEAKHWRNLGKILLERLAPGKTCRRASIYSTEQVGKVRISDQYLLAMLELIAQLFPDLQ